MAKADTEVPVSCALSRLAVNSPTRAPVLMSHMRTTPLSIPQQARSSTQLAEMCRGVEPPLQVARSSPLSTFQTLTVPSLEPLSALPLVQSTCTAVTSSVWASMVLRQAPSLSCHSRRRPSTDPAKARSELASTESARTEHAPPVPKSRTCSPSARLYILRPPSLDPENAHLSAGSRTACPLKHGVTRWTQALPGVIPCSSSVVSLGKTSAHHSSCWQDTGTESRDSRRALTAPTRSLHGTDTRARVRPCMLCTAISTRVLVSTPAAGS
mmetsp:Transcript_84158/g.219848  ORF Transcript_84158/g.219848 Transcript_84158/m.219848 type:complete len:269 (-) Transcript_84158:143-949(-)